MESILNQCSIFEDEVTIRIYTKFSVTDAPPALVARIKRAGQSLAVKSASASQK